MRFRHSRSRLASALLALFALTCAAETKWRWNGGQSRSYELRIVRSQTALADRSYKSKLSARAALGFRAGTSAEDYPTLQMKIGQLLIERRAGKSYSFFDSEADCSDGENDSAWETLGRALLANDYTLSQTPAGAIKLLEGTGESGGRAFESALDSNPREAFLLLQIFGDRRFTQLLNSLMHVLPDDRAAEKTNWSRSEDVELGFGVVLRRSMDYSIENAGDEQLFIQIAGRVEPTEGSEGSIELPGGSADVQITANSIKGQAVFSNTEGCISEIELHGELDIKMMVQDKSSPGRANEVRSRLVQDASLKLVPENGVGR